jgi:hypothetical protein
VPQDMKLVEQNGRLGRVPAGRLGKGLPHVHDGQADAPAGLQPQLFVELVQASLGAVLPPRTTGADAGSSR